MVSFYKILLRFYSIFWKSINKIGTFCWGMLCGKIGNNVEIERGVKIINPKGVFIEDGVRIGKYVYIEAGLKKINFGKNVIIGKGCIIVGGTEGLKIGDSSSLNAECYIGSEGGVSIGKFVMIAGRCSIITSSHAYSDWKKPMCRQVDSCGPVIIEDDVWLGNGVSILSNIRIGRGSIVGAGAVVTKDVEPFSIVGGVPAKFIKYRFSKEDIKKAQEVDLDKILE